MITTVTLNVAIDKAYVVDALEKGHVMRVQKCTNTPGGKGLNVAKVAKLCGEDVVATGFVGGHAGAYVEEMLNAQQVKNDFVHTANETRSCINILASDGSSTEFLEPGAPVTGADVEAFLDKFAVLVQKSDVLTISGSVPEGVPVDIYARMVTLAKRQGRQIFLDTSGELLKEGVKACPTLIKPNDDEIEALLGVPVSNREEILAGAKKLHEMGVAYVVVSLGADGALVVCDEGVYHGRPPKIETVNTVGCGDSMLGAFAVAFSRKQPVEEALAYAVAVSAANALTMATGHFETADMERLLPEVTVERLA